MKVILLVIYILVIVVWAIISLIAMALAWLYSLLFDKERRPVMALSRVVARMVYLFSPVWRVRVEGAEKLDPKQTYVITCNHQSFFDIPLAFFLPLWKFKFVSKVEVRNIPAIGWMLGMRGHIVIRRGTASAAVAVMEQGTEHLKAGTSVFIFPEGTRTKDGNIHRYKDGAFPSGPGEWCGHSTLCDAGHQGALQGPQAQLPQAGNPCARPHPCRAGDGNPRKGVGREGEGGVGGGLVKVEC